MNKSGMGISHSNSDFMTYECIRLHMLVGISLSTNVGNSQLLGSNRCLYRF